MKTETLHLQFYTKSECPLCDEAKVVLERIAAQRGYVAVQEIDITANLGLFTKYKYLIPVLELEGERLFVHHVIEWKLVWRLRWHRLRRFFGTCCRKR